MKQVDKIKLDELKEMSKKMHGSMVKAVVDVQKKLVVVDADLHVDEEQMLLESGSSQQDLWGINLWPENYGKDNFIEYDSMINIRPSQNNPSRSVESAETRKQIEQIVNEVVHE